MNEYKVTYQTTTGTGIMENHFIIVMSTTASKALDKANKQLSEQLGTNYTILDIQAV